MKFCKVYECVYDNITALEITLKHFQWCCTCLIMAPITRIDGSKFIKKVDHFD